ncbi:MAG: AMP-binding protein [SAR202 cluster bacterium]|nr:AMP-binding protein [SAR202 cluster bacterium]
MAEWFKKGTLGTLLDEAAERWGPREALYYAGQRWSFAQLQAEVNLAARAFVRLGIQPGDKVSLWMPNRPEWLYCFFALAKVGAVTVPINTRFRTNDLEYVVRQSDSTTLITVDRSGPVDYLGMVREVCPEIKWGNPNDLRPARFPELKRVLVLGDSPYPGTHRWDEAMAAGEAAPQEEVERRHQRVGPDETVVIMYTSGTTGFPKGVMHCHNVQRTVMDLASRMGVTSRDVILMYLPLFHCFGLYMGPLMSVISGARMVLTTLFDPGEALRLIQQERATILHGFDTHFHALTTHPDCEKAHRSSLRIGILAAGMASSEPAARRAQKLLCPTLSAWGMTEVGVGAALSFLDSPEDDRCLTSGYPLPGYEFKVFDPATGAVVPPRSMGELWVRGYGLMQGYYKKPEETARIIDPEGWLHTGDVVTMREDGVIRFLGRYKDLLKVGGENVDPVEVERLLLNHPAIDQVQVVGVPDLRLSEVPCACVVPKAGQQVANEELAALCRGKLASFKIPRHTLIMEEFPMTSSGKVQRFRLREMAVEKLGLLEAVRARTG